MQPDVAWDEFVATNGLGSYMQASAWATVKAANGWSAAYLRAGSAGHEVGAQVLLRRPGRMPWTYAYAPRGPLASAWDRAAVETFSTSVRTELARHAGRISHLRIDPEVEADGPDDPGGALREALRATGWRGAPAILPASTHVVDLAPSEEELWSGLRKKWRQYVSRARGQVSVVEGGRADLGEFYSIYRDTAVRTGFTVRAQAHYERVWDAFSPASGCRVLFARLPSGDAAATLFLVRAGDRVAEPWGGMTPMGADTRASYLLKWEAIRSSRAAGGSVYDMWGGLTFPGVAHFKRGFGGRDIEYIGTWDLVLDPAGWFVYAPVRRAVAETERALRRVQRALGRSVEPASATED